MSKRQKSTSVVSYFAKQRRKDSTETQKHEQDTDFSMPTCSSTSASQSTEFDYAEECITLDRPSEVRVNEIN